MPFQLPDASVSPRAAPGAGETVWRKLRRAISDSLREYPVFSLEERPDEGTEVERAASSLRPDVVEAIALSEEQREPLYAAQWTRILLVRLRLASLIGIFCMMLFVGFYYVLFPGLTRAVAGIGALTVLGLIAQFVLTFRTSSLRGARVLMLLGFALFSASSACALALVNVPVNMPVEVPLNAPGAQGARAVQFVIAVSFTHILITTLVLPLRLRDTLGISVVALGALCLGLRAIPASMQTVSASGVLWLVGTVAGFVALLALFNGRLRRRVFDSAFNLALQAARLKEMSETDALLGGFNRRHIERTLVNELARAARFGRPLSLLMFDLDNFKPVNDTLGHAAGDQVLRAIHELAKSQLREVDTLARYGGDEFLILLPETDDAQANHIAARLRERVSRELPARFQGDALRAGVTLSVGVLTLESGHTLALDVVLERVDGLLYSAKKAGKNRVMGAVEVGI